MIDRAFERQMQIQSVQMERAVGMRTRGMDPTCHGCGVEYESPKWTGHHTCEIGKVTEARLVELVQKRARKKSPGRTSSKRKT